MIRSYSSHGNSHIGGGQGRRVVDPVADHHHRPIALPKSIDPLQLLGRKQTGMHFVDSPNLLRNSLGDARVVPREHHDADLRMHAPKLAKSSAARSAQLIGSGDVAHDVSVFRDHHHRVTAILGLLDVAMQTAVAVSVVEKTVAANRNSVAHDLALNAEPSEGSHRACRCVAVRDLALPRMLEHSFCEGVRRRFWKRDIMVIWWRRRERTHTCLPRSRTRSSCSWAGQFGDILNE